MVGHEVIGDEGSGVGSEVWLGERVDGVGGEHLLLSSAAVTVFPTRPLSQGPGPFLVLFLQVQRTRLVAIFAFASRFYDGF